MRSGHLSGDTVPTIDVVVDLLNRLEKKYEYLLLLQPTSPVRLPRHLDDILAILMEQDIDAVVSVEHMDEPHPEKVKKINSSGFLEPYIQGTSSEIPRQQLPKAFRLNGAIYAIEISTLIKEKTFLPRRTSAYQMPKGINIDSEEDFIYLKVLYEMGRLNIYGLDH